jgi:hypothetical protein
MRQAVPCKGCLQRALLSAAASRFNYGGAAPRRLPGSASGVRCLVAACERAAHSLGYCTAHYRRHRLYGDPLGLSALRSDTTLEDLRWRAARGAPGTHTSPAGYVYRHGVIDGRKRRFAEHRLVMEYFLRRDLLPHEEVHHKNGDRSDNRRRNLELWSTSQPAGQRIADKLAWAQEIVALYGDDPAAVA